MMKQIFIQMNLLLRVASLLGILVCAGCTTPLPQKKAAASEGVGNARTEAVLDCVRAASQAIVHGKFYIRPNIPLQSIDRARTTFSTMPLREQILAIYESGGFQKPKVRMVVGALAVYIVNGSAGNKFYAIQYPNASSVLPTVSSGNQQDDRTLQQLLATLSGDEDLRDETAGYVQRHQTQVAAPPARTFSSGPPQKVPASVANEQLRADDPFLKPRGAPTQPHRVAPIKQSPTDQLRADGPLPPPNSGKPLPGAGATAKFPPFPAKVQMEQRPFKQPGSWSPAGQPLIADAADYLYMQEYQLWKVLRDVASDTTVDLDGGFQALSDHLKTTKNALTDGPGMSTLTQAIQSIKVNRDGLPTGLRYEDVKNEADEVIDQLNMRVKMASTLVTKIDMLSEEIQSIQTLYMAAKGISGRERAAQQARKLLGELIDQWSPTFVAKE